MSQTESVAREKLSNPKPGSASNVTASQVKAYFQEALQQMKQEVLIETQLAAMRIIVSPLSHAEYYHTLEEGNLIHMAMDASDFHIKPRTPPFARVWHTTKNDFHKFLNKIVSRDASTGKESQLQEAWMKDGDWCAFFGISSTSKMHDTSKSPLSSGRKPDIVHVVPGHYPSEVSIVAVGDLKRLKTKRKGMKKETATVESIGQRNSNEVPAKEAAEEEFENFLETNFSPDSKGRALYFARVIYEAQPFRRNHGVVSYTSNGNSIMFFLYSPTRILQSPPLSLKSIGGEWYFGLMTTNLKDFGMVLPSVNYEGLDKKIFEISLHECLGSGGSGVVYLCSCAGIEGQFVMKYFEDQEALNRELENLNLIRQSTRFVDLVIRSIGLTIDKRGLLLNPICKDLSSSFDLGYTGFQLIQLIRLVEDINNRSLVLRDLRPSNVVIQSDGSICLIDLGSVVRHDDFAPYEGTSKFASDRILKLLCEFAKTPRVSGWMVNADIEDDYHSLVKICYVSIVARSYARLRLISSFDYPAIVRFWEERLSCESWKRLEEKVDYRKLIEFVEHLIPTTSAMPKLFGEDDEA
eukprot:gene3280-3497_t